MSNVAANTGTSTFCCNTGNGDGDSYVDDKNHHVCNDDHLATEVITGGSEDHLVWLLRPSAGTTWLTVTNPVPAIVLLKLQTFIWTYLSTYPYTLADPSDNISSHHHWLGPPGWAPAASSSYSTWLLTVTKPAPAPNFYRNHTKLDRSRQCHHLEQACHDRIWTYLICPLETHS